MSNPPSNTQFDWKMYRYDPSLAGATLAMSIFFILSLLHTWHYLALKSHIIIYMIIGCTCEVIGFAARIGSHFNSQAWASFIIQGTFLLIGPLFFAATIYMMLGRTIRLAGGEDASLIRPVWYTRVFVTADITTLCIQGTGAGIMGTMQLALAIAGNNIVIAGLALQVATFVIFLVASIDVHIRMDRKYKAGSSGYVFSNWRKMFWTLYGLSMLVLFRCIFRLIEYAMGNAAYLMAHEWPLYCFDAVPMALVAVLFLVVQPARYVLQQEKVDDSSDGELRPAQSS